MLRYKTETRPGLVTL